MKRDISIGGFSLKPDMEPSSMPELQMVVAVTLAGALAIIALFI